MNHTIICRFMSTSSPCLSAGIWENGESLAESRLNFVSKVPGSYRYDDSDDSEDRTSQRLANVADCMVWVLIAARNAKDNGKPMGKVRFGVTDMHAVHALNSDRAEPLQSLTQDDKEIFHWIVFLRGVAQVEVEFFHTDVAQRSRVTHTLETIESSRGWRSETSKISLSERRAWTESLINVASTIRDNASSLDFQENIIKRLKNCLTFIEELEDSVSFMPTILDSPSKKRVKRIPFSQDVGISPSKRSQERKPSSSKRPVPYSRLQRPAIFEPPRTPKRATRKNLEADGSPSPTPLGSWDSPGIELQRQEVLIYDSEWGYLGPSFTGETPASAKVEQLPLWMVEKWRGDRKRK
ncbi:hypothetical protein CYLTODRAFT_407317 [Cylindrobasidium torrendii FP15055 ss-10]|uniref:Uncharacterized protein n=1 Tax=Cylindrobasidium torrendii FP15055 ss-10 TaxID=1314674 RepID=A0A0D7BQU8_9AGAR|nr:hypothetical protein CYLTODRAFT_407317 [Cylindrobasidium torrendii FP15055 ss-10]